MIEILNYHSDTSSTLVRELLQNNRNTKNVLDKDVLEYIRKHRLY